MTDAIAKFVEAMSGTEKTTSALKVKAIAMALVAETDDAKAVSDADWLLVPPENRAIFLYTFAAVVARNAE